MIHPENHIRRDPLHFQQWHVSCKGNELAVVGFLFFLTHIFSSPARSWPAASLWGPSLRLEVGRYTEVSPSPVKLTAFELVWLVPLLVLVFKRAFCIWVTGLHLLPLRSTDFDHPMESLVAGASTLQGRCRSLNGTEFNRLGAFASCAKSQKLSGESLRCTNAVNFRVSSDFAVSKRSCKVHL